MHIGAGCQELSGARIPHNQQNGTRQALLDILCVVSAESIGCKITLNITVFTGPKKWIDDIQYWHISPSFYEVHTKEQGDVSYRDDEASWGDLAQSRHCQHLLKWVWQKKLLSQQSQIQTFVLTFERRGSSGTLRIWTNKIVYILKKNQWNYVFIF